jgi:hypothetical protein
MGIPDSDVMIEHIYYGHCQTQYEGQTQNGSVSGTEGVVEYLRYHSKGKRKE